MKTGLAFILLASSLALTGGCKRTSPAESVAPLVGAFSVRAVDKPSAGAAVPVSGGFTIEETQRNQQLAALAVSAFKSNDMVTVSSSLQALRSTRAMTDEQRMTVQDAMINFQKTMAERADRGDAAAQEALDYLRGGHLRR